jgi:NADP-dependent 3-hydroxy acid dehydrogenase YdfG
MNTDDRNKKVVAVVTGSSSGIGFETSVLLAKNGYLPTMLQFAILINLTQLLI